MENILLTVSMFIIENQFKMVKKKDKAIPVTDHEWP
jgi:hypothetical protein